MATPDKLADESQAAELFSAIETRGFVFGIALRERSLWNIGSLVLPEAVAIRSDVPAELREDYSLLAFTSLPNVPEPQSVLNFLRRNDTDQAVISKHIQYRVRRLGSGVVKLNKYYPSEPEGFETLDAIDRTRDFEESLDDMFPMLPDPDKPEDIRKAIREVLRFTLDELTVRMERKRSAEALSRQLGLTRVFADEADALLALISSAGE
jgi:hypothetical protein